jgi:hypothetical protein
MVNVRIQKGVRFQGNVDFFIVLKGSSIQGTGTNKKKFKTGMPRAFSTQWSSQ